MSGITTVIFDVYETLAPNRPDQWLATFQGVCQEQRLPVSPQTLWTEWKALEVNFRQHRVNLESLEQSPPFKTYAQAWAECFRGVFEKLGLKGDTERAACKAVEALARRELFDDARDILPRIQAQWRTAVLSNADDAYLLPLLARHGLEFQAVLSSEGARAYKPHPSAFHQILHKLGIAPAEAVYVGDKPYEDVLGAKLVGMWAVWLNRNGTSYDSSMPPPDAEIRSLHQLSKVLERL